MIYTWGIYNLLMYYWAVLAWGPLVCIFIICDFISFPPEKRWVSIVNDKSKKNSNLFWSVLLFQQRKHSEYKSYISDNNETSQVNELYCKYDRITIFLLSETTNILTFWY